MYDVNFAALQSMLIDERHHLKKIDGKNYTQLNLAEVKEYLESKFDLPNEALGATILELVEILQEQGAVKALNLDGGGSSSLVINGKLQNKIFFNNNINKSRKLHNYITFKITQ